MKHQHPDFCGIDIIPLPAFRDNYIWLLVRGDSAVAVDPGDAEVVERHLAGHGLTLRTILVTHHHPDHVGGLEALLARRDIPVFGPAAEPISGVDRPLAEGDAVPLPELGVSFRALEVPGHTRTHIAYLAPGVLFCGDTLFSAGCGRLLGGTADQLHDSLQRLAALPADTAVYCTHEYTLANLAFARAADPDNPARDAWAAECEALRAAGRPTLPSRIGRERDINPFLRTDTPGVIATVTAHAGSRPGDSRECFTRLRAWKDSF